MKKILFIFLLLPVVLICQPEYSEPGAGAFSRMGFGARGIGMANSMSAVNTGNLVAYYNPAVIVYQENNSFQAGYSFLSLDRSLNFLNYTRKFDFYSAKDTATINRKPRSTAGLSIGIVNAGVSEIDEYDNSGTKFGTVSTSENMAFLGLANRFSEKFSLGIAIKFFYYSLYEDISANGVGLDVGALYRLNNQWNISLVISDLNSKYKWDSAPLYDQLGSTPTNNFPVRKKAGISYRNEEAKLLVSAEIENRNKNINIIRFGAEYNIYDGFYLRGGIDQWNLSNADFPVKPAAGFTYLTNFDNLKVSVDYAYMIEQYSPSDRHIVGLSFQF